MVRKSLGFFRAIGNSQTYLNILYLLFSFPLGLIYFIFIITGISLGLGLFITWFGIPILLGVMYMWLSFSYIERKLSSTLLNVKIPYFYTPEVKERTFWKRLKKRLTDSTTWKSFVYLILKFPLGIISFVMLITFISVTFSLIATPFVYYLDSIGIITGICVGSTWCALYNWPVAIFACLVGIFMIFISIAIFNGLAYVSGLLSRELLKKEKRVVRRSKRRTKKRR